MESERATRRDPGFTLIELLIVIVILGILATVVVFSVGGVTEKGEAGTCKIDERTLATAVEAYFGQFETLAISPSGTSEDRYELTLQSAGFLRDVSVNWNVEGDGSLTAQSPVC